MDKKKAEFKTYVNPALGVVVAKHPTAAREMIVDFIKIFDKISRRLNMEESNPILKAIAAIGYSWFVKNENKLNNLTAKAYCNFDAEDEFDEEFGKKLAKKRLAVKLDRYRMNLFDTLANEAYSLFEEFEVYSNAIDDKRWRTLESIDEMVYGVEE